MPEAGTHESRASGSAFASAVEEGSRPRSPWDAARLHLHRVPVPSAALSRGPQQEKGSLNFVKNGRPTVRIPDKSGKLKCTRCMRLLLSVEFRPHSRKHPHLIRSWCRTCQGAARISYMKSYNAQRDPVQLAAQRAVRTAVQNGAMHKPSKCSRCRTITPQKILDGHHHKGYEHPLIVVWLCRACHRLEHCGT